MKIICESCETVFKAEAVKGMTNCPVCGAAFDEGGGNVNNQGDKEEEGLMYLDEINIYPYHFQSSNVTLYCKECNTDNFLKLDDFDELSEEEYVILKEGVVVKCQGCGKEQKPRKILYKEKDSDDDNSSTSSLPHCPICNSTMLKKISLTSKVMATAALGVLANPHNSKTYECKNCGYKF